MIGTSYKSTIACQVPSIINLAGKFGKARVRKKSKNRGLTNISKAKITLLHVTEGKKEEQLARDFGSNAGSVHRTIILGQQLLSEYVPGHVTDNEVNGFEKALQEAIVKYPEIIEKGYVTIDGTLIHTQNQYQVGFYSGKHGTNGVKTLAIATPSGIPFYFTELVPGSQHDMKMLSDTTVVQTLEDYGIGIVGDKGFQGLDPEKHLTPVKKTKGGRLTRHQKEFNYWVTLLRIKVETVFARIKQYKIMRKCRQRTKNIPKAFQAALGLHFLEGKTW